MSGKILEVMNRFKFKNRLIVFMGLIIAIPIIILNLIFYYAYVSFYNSKIAESYYYICNDSYTNLTYKLDLYSNIVDKTAFNKNIIRAMNSIEQDNMMTNYQSSQIIDDEIENIVVGTSTEEIYQLLLYPIDPDIKGMGKYLSSISNIAYASWIQTMENKSKTFFFEEKMGNEILSLVQVMYHIDEMTNETKPIALVKAEINMDSVLDNTISDNNHGMEIEFSKDKQPLYSYKRISDNTTKRDILTKEKNLLGEKLQISYYLDQVSERKMRSMILLAVIVLIILPISFLVLVIIKFSDNTNQRVAVIFNKIKRIQGGDFDVTVSLDGNDEFADIDSRLEKMASNLKQIINERYILENERKKAQLSALQMQINPHFMYNTLETINSIAKQAGLHDISIISQKMGKILRYNINYNDREFVCLSQEIDNVECYLSIQKIRFGDRLSVFYDIPPELNQCIVLKFTLQPMVENAVKYAVQDAVGNSMIAITAEVEEKDLIIRIQDDGNGISERKLFAIRESLKTDTYKENEKIGLKNVHSRIRLTYGKPYGVEMFSKKNKGTSVHLRFPLIEYSEGEEK